MLEFQPTDQFTLFPTQLYRGEIKDTQWLKQMQIYIDTVSAPCYDRSWQSSDDLHQQPEFAELTELILALSERVLCEQSVVYDRVWITGMWANRTGANAEHKMHLHPNSYLSGVVYISAPELCSPIIFSDPRPARAMIEYQYQQLDWQNASTFLEQPQPGVDLLWPSWLPHGVEQGSSTSEASRISIAFNLMVEHTVSLPTKKIHYRP